jgi:Uncharacterized protein conserved in bacteria
MAEATGTGLEADIVTGLVAPAGTPSEIIDLLHRTIAKIVAPRDFNDRLLALGFDPVASTATSLRTGSKTNLPSGVKSFARLTSPCSDSGSVCATPSLRLVRPGRTAKLQAGGSTRAV